MISPASLTLPGIALATGLLLSGCGGGDSSLPGGFDFDASAFDNTPDPGDADFPFSPGDPEYEDYLEFLTTDDGVQMNQDMAYLTPVPTFADRDFADNNFYKSENNSRLMVGAPVGTNNAGSSPLASDMEVYVRQSDHGLRIGSVRKVYDMNATYNGYTPDQLFVGVLHNISGELRCEVNLSVENMVGREGKIFSGDQNIIGLYVYGEVGISPPKYDGDPPSYHHDCISPDSRVYFVFKGPELDDESVSKINFNKLYVDSAWATEYTIDDSRLLPDGFTYNLAEEGDRDNIYVTITNRGTDSRSSYSGALYIYQNSGGQPIAINRNANSEQLQVMEVGVSKQIMLHHAFQAFPGSASRIRGVIVGNEPTEK